jgi:hypothetical protein
VSTRLIPRSEWSKEERRDQRILSVGANTFHSVGVNTFDSTPLHFAPGLEFHEVEPKLNLAKSFAPGLGFISIFHDIIS